MKFTLSSNAQVMAIRNMAAVMTVTKRNEARDQPYLRPGVVSSDSANASHPVSNMVPQSKMAEIIRPTNVRLANDVTSGKKCDSTLPVIAKRYSGKEP